MTRKRLPSLLLALAPMALLTAPAAVPAQQKPTANWSNTVTRGANGAYVIGNPDAPAKLVEYLSYTCHACADFAKNGAPPLKSGPIARGQVSLEVRNYVRDPFDLTAAMLARCGGERRFLANHETLFANYEAWMKQATAFKPTRSTDDQIAMMTEIADKTGLFALLAKRGLTPAAQRACLADKTSLSQVLALTASVWDHKEFTGTPFFVLDGKGQAGVHDWEALRPLLRTR